MSTACAELDYERLERATASLQAPFALVDLDAMWSNAQDMERRAGGKPIRLASKSLRCRALQEQVLARPGFCGTLAFTLPEAQWLASHGLQDIVVAYPSADLGALQALAARGGGAAQVTVMIDGIEQLELIDRALAGCPSPSRVRVCLDADAGWQALGARVKVGVKRSPLHEPEQVAALAREVLARPALSLVGLMAYEAQVAGVGDSPAGRPLRALAIRAMQRLSMRELATRRAAIVAAVQDVLAQAGAPALQFVNGGGTGSLQRTRAERCVTELSAGSGLYAPALFDSYSAFSPRPAALFALPVVRRPAAGAVTVLGGGYVASGPADGARLPRPQLPAGLALDRREGAGEVQTPLLGAPADALAVGDRVYFRHAKAGELSERFATLHLLQGGRIVGAAPTYRGEGRCFL